jgi:AcrR family transcriptional regulator
MPKLWNDTIESHRHKVRDTTLDAAASLVAEHGLASVTMSAIAHRTGIARATLYRYFPDVEAILAAWHERQVGAHLEMLSEVRDHTDDPGDRLPAVLRAYARLAQNHESSDLSTSLHRAEHVATAQQQLHHFLRDLITEGAARGELRADIPAGELASYCLHALTAAATATTEAALERLVTLTLDALGPLAAGT